MKVLWFTNTPCNYQKKTGNRGYNGGGWLSSLEDEIIKQQEIELGICFCQDGQPFKANQDGVTYYPIPRHTKSMKDKVLDILRYNNVKRDTILWEHYERHFKRAIDEFKPDIIHIFGSELYMGLATFVAPCPVVLHIQGILSLYIYIHGSRLGFQRGATSCRIGIPNAFMTVFNCIFIGNAVATENRRY